MNIDHARFDQSAPVGNINFKDVIEPRSRDQKRIGFGQRAARQTGARATRHDGNAVSIGPLDGEGDFFGRIGKGDGQRSHFGGDESVTFVDHQVGVAGNHRFGAEQRFQFAQGGLHGA